MQKVQAHGAILYTTVHCTCTVQVQYENPDGTFPTWNILL